jgi:hypothetical protein
MLLFAASDEVGKSNIDEVGVLWWIRGMRTLLTLAAVLLCSLALPAQDAAQAATLARQKQVALQYAKATGKSPAECLNAVQMLEWCLAYPQGSVMHGVTYDAAATAQQMALAKKFLTTPAASVYTTGSLANRPAMPMGRSSHDPERIKERMIREGNYKGVLRLQVEEAIVQAIATHHLVEIWYDGKIAIVEPHMLALNQRNHRCVSAWWVEGVSIYGPGWREYLIDKIEAIQVLNQTFDGVRPGYNPTGGKVFHSIAAGL